MNKQDLQKHLLIVDDDQRIRALLEKFLREHHYLVDSAQNACQARQLAQTMIYDLLVIDIMMPGEENGLDFVTALRGGDLCAHRDTPVLLLTARGEIDDRLTGLSVGADDYLSKPFEPQELLLRIAAILRRTSKLPAPSKVIEFGPWRYDLQSCRLYHKDTLIYLTTGEVALLDILGRAPEKVFSRAALLQTLPGDSGESRAIDVQINRLRKKLEIDPRQPAYLQTVRGKGYRLQTKL